MYSIKYSATASGLALTNELIVIESLLHDHDAIREHMKMVASLMEGWEEVEQESLDAPDSQLISVIRAKQVNLKQTMGYLDDGLQAHQMHEEDVMTELIGYQLMEAIKIEHREIHKQLGEINFILLNVNLSGLIANLDYIRLVIGNLCSLIETHCGTEDTILKLLKRKFI